MKKMIPVLFLSALLFSPWQSFAQTSEIPKTPEVSNTKQYSLDPIVVTAKKIETDKQDLPSSISVIDSNMMEDFGLETVDGMIKFVPNVDISKIDSFHNQLIYRGIGGMPSVNYKWNTNLDGVIMPYIATNMNLDVERIEILRGAQGSLYGRNSQAGIINLITNAPGDSPNANASVSYESFNTIKAQAAVGGPIGDMYGYRLAVGYNQTDGYFKNDTLDKDDTNKSNQVSVRGKLVFTPSDTNKLTLSLYADEAYSAFSSYTTEKSAKDKPSIHVHNNVLGHNEAYIISPTLTWEKEFSSFDMVSITNYTNSGFELFQDSDFTRLDLGDFFWSEDYNTVSQEFRFSGTNGSNLQWLVGAFALYEHLDTTTDQNFGTDAGLWGMPIGSYMRQDSTIETYVAATFAQFTYRPFSKLELTGTLRLDYEKKDVDWANSNTVGMPIDSIKTSGDWLALSPSASAAWLFTENHQAYISVSRGFQAGDFNSRMQTAALMTEVDPEYITTYEIGYKGRHLNNKLETNLALFYINWDNMQVDIFDPVTVQNSRINAAKAHSSGIELEVQALLMPGLEAFANMGYMFEYEFDEFQQSATSDLSGNKLPNTSQYNITVGSVYRNDFGLFVGADVSFKGKKYFDIDNNLPQNPYFLVNAKVGYESENWDMYIYGRNILNEAYNVNGYPRAGYDPVTGNTDIWKSGEPLSIGVQFSVRF